jgi:hypothetical protein
MLVSMLFGRKMQAMEAFMQLWLKLHFLLDLKKIG